MRKELVQLREARDLTQDQAAAELKISRSFYCELELGTKDPSLEVLNKLVNLFGPRVAEFFLPIRVASSDAVITEIPTS